MGHSVAECPTLFSRERRCDAATPSRKHEVNQFQSLFSREPRCDFNFKLQFLPMVGFNPFSAGNLVATPSPNTLAGTEFQGLFPRTCHHGARFGRHWLALIKLLQQNHSTAIARTTREMKRGMLTPRHGNFDTGKNASPGMGYLPPRMPTTFLSLTGASFALTWQESNSAAASLARLTVSGRNWP